jgi:hypothetical protein
VGDEWQLGHLFLATDPFGEFTPDPVLGVGDALDKDLLTGLGMMLGSHK